MNAQQLAEIKERVAKATPGEWDVFDDIWVAQGDGLTIGENIAKCEVEADAEFVAYARQDVPDLIAEVERLQEALFDVQFNSLEILDGFVGDSDVVRLMEIAQQALREGNNA